MSGSGQTSLVTGGLTGTYGSLGMPAAGNTPGSRIGAASWTDHNGNLWLFGGYGYALPNSPYYLNDLWEYEPSAPAPVPSFALFQVPTPGTPTGALRFAAGSSGTGTINVVTSGGFNSPVALATRDLPQGIKASLSPSTTNVPGSSQISIDADYTLNEGTHPLTVTGTSGSTTETGTFLLTLEAAPPPNFDLGISSPSLTVKRGSQGTITLTVTPLYGFNSPVTFSCTGLPTGATCTFDPATVAPSDTAITTKLTISTSTQSFALRPYSRPLYPVTVLAGALCFLGFMKRRRPVLRLAMACACLMLVFGCGGGSPGGGYSTPPPVTSTVIITATSEYFWQTAALSLTIR